MVRGILTGICMVGLAAALARAQATVVIDGLFDDWEGVTAAIVDPVDNPAGEVDFGAVKVSADARFLAIAVDLRRVVHVLQDSWMVLIDADGSPSSGQTLHAMDGVDVAVEFSPNWARGRLRRATSAGFDAGSAIGLETGPDYAHAWREVRVSRSHTSMTGTRARVKLVALKGARTIDETTAIDVAMPAYDASPVVVDSATDPLARAEGTDFRVVVWNVFGFPNRVPERNRQPVFARMLAALDADVLLLNEVDGPPSAVERWLPPAQAGGRWQIVTRGELAIASRAGAVEPVFTGRLLAPPATGFYPTLFELIFGRSAVSAIGAVVHIGDRRVLAVPLHLPCCGASAERIAQAPVLRDAVRDAVGRSRPDALLVGGDFNLLIDRAPLETVRQGVLSRDESLAVVEARHLNGLSAATYQGGERHPPTRLDWLMHDSALTLLRAFVFEADDLSPRWLTTHGLEARDSDSTRTSDHRPIVADFRWQR